MINIWVHSNIAKLADDKMEWQFNLTEKSIKLAKLLEIVFSEEKHLHFGIIDELGSVRKHINIFVGSTNIKSLSGLETEIADSDSISIFTAVSGG